MLESLKPFLAVSLPSNVMQLIILFSGEELRGVTYPCPQNLAGYVLEEFAEDSELHNQTVVKPRIALGRS